MTQSTEVIDDILWMQPVDTCSLCGGLITWNYVCHGTELTYREGTCINRHEYCSSSASPYRSAELSHVESRIFPVTHRNIHVLDGRFVYRLRQRSGVEGKWMTVGRCMVIKMRDIMEAEEKNPIEWCTHGYEDIITLEDVLNLTLE